MKSHLSLVGAGIKLADLQIVVLESPNETMLYPEAKKLFSNIVELRIKGYTDVHSNAILPLDTTDFIATHLLVCTKDNPFDNVLMSYKSTSFLICKKFNIAFPFMAILEKNAHPNCSNEMKRVLEECEKKHEDLSYEAGWTMDPIIRENKELNKILKEMVTTFVINHHRDYAIPHWATLGICKVKTDQLFLKMGLKEISDKPMLSHPYLLQTDARAVIVMNNGYSDYTFQTCKIYQDLWDDRITICSKEMAVKKKAA